MESVIRGHHVYKNIWHPVLEEQLTLERENSNIVMTDTLSWVEPNLRGKNTLKDGTIVGHLPREL